MSYKSPIAPVIANPVLLDKEIAGIQSKMSDISWIDKSFARALKFFKLVKGVKISYPAIFQTWKKDYYNAYPNDNIKKGYSFVFVDPDQVVEFNSRLIHEIEQDLSVIVFFNLEEIDNTLLYRFTEKLKEDVIFALSSLPSGRLQINNITDGVEESFSDFTISQIKSEFLKAKYGAFKFDCTIFYKNDNCDLNVFAP